MKTKKSTQPKLKDFSNYCVVNPVNEKCKKILNSNLDDDLKVELIGLLQNPQPNVTIIPYVEPYVTWTTWPFDSGKTEVTCESR